MLSALTDVLVSSWRVKFFVTFLISKVGHFTHYAHLSLHFRFGFCGEADADWFGLFTFCIVLEFCAKFIQFSFCPVFILEV